MGGNGNLETWDAVKGETAWEAILVGNGASRAIWDKFQYDSLYDVAHKVDHSLTAKDDQIFSKLDTRNFERVLRALRDARIVNEALGLETTEVKERYGAIQRALAEAVAKVHVPWASVSSSDVLLALRKHLLQDLRYKLIFSTNYDLVLYWTILVDDPAPQDVKDFFWQTVDDKKWLVFDSANVDVYGSVSRVLYLHGGLHIYRLPDGRVAKYSPSKGENLLDAFQNFMTTNKDPGPLPLFVAEGDANDKRKAIASSDYLSFAYEQLGKCNGPIVIFGHSLGDSDAHIANALDKRERRIAISVMPGSLADITKRTAHYRECLPKSELHFFDATTHPLGDSQLRITTSSEVRP